MLAGAIMGALGSLSLLLNNALPVQMVLYVAANLMLLAMGLYLLGVTRAAAFIEKAGNWLWQRIQPFSKRFLPVRSVRQAFPLGMLWGWLPCGLVYSVLVTALASGHAQSGALIMLAFGLGTLPNLLAIGLFWESVKGWVQSPRMRLAAGLLVAAFGVYGLSRVGYTFYVNGWSGSCHVSA
jgi:sulfite exporter TauE/SafE